MTPDQYCQQKTKASHSNFALAFFFLSKKKRLALTALYAFCREVDDIVDDCKEKTVGKNKLDEWRLEIDRLFDQAPKHPVSVALSPHITSCKLDKKHFIEIIDGMEMDLNCNRYNDLKKLKIYCYRAASAVGLLSAHIFGYTNKSTLKYAHDLGLALQITNIIRDIAEDSERGRIYIPLELLDKYNISENDILHNKNNKQIALLVDELSKLAKNYYQSAINHLPDEDKEMQKPGLIMGNIYFILLQKIMKGNTGNTLDNRVSLSTYKKLMIAITTSLGKTWIY